MARSFEKFQKRRLISSYISVVLSISLVLFLLGLLGLLVLNSKKVADHFKENIALSIFLKDNAKQVEIDQLQQTLSLAPYTKSTNFVSKEQAAEEHSALIGENFMDFLGYNPLQNSIDVFLLADYVAPDQLAAIQEELIKNGFIDSVSYDKPLIILLTENIKKISFWVLVMSALFLIIAVLLINSSIRLSVYAKRFTIKTMQLVGATSMYIRKPFLGQALFQGLLSSLIGLALLLTVFYGLNNLLETIQIAYTLESFLLLIGLLFAIGVFITMLSTWFALNKYLRMKLDDLY